MDYLTRHYKHLCEQLQEKINVLEKFLIERPSIEDQIETGNETILNVGTGKTKGHAKTGNVKVPFDITIDPELSKTSTRGEFRSSNLAVTRRLYPKLFDDTKELKGTIALDPSLKVDDDDFYKAVKDQDTVAHEAAHAHQLAAKTRDAEQRKAQGKTTYADVEMSKIEKTSTSQRSSNPRLTNVSPEVKSGLEYSQYYLNPQEINARSSGAGTMAYRIRSGGGDRTYSFNVPKIGAEVGLEYVAGGSKVSPEETAAMSRHERSVAKRKNLFASQDLKNATARGVLKAEQDMATPNPEVESTKARQNAIKAKVETLKAKTEQPKISTPEVAPTQKANVVSKIIDPTSAVIQATTAQASKIAPQAALKPLPGTQIKGVGTGMSIGAGILGGLAGEFVVKPTAEKLGVFDAVEKGSKKLFSKMPDWAVKASDKTLGAAQVALDPIGSAFDASIDMRSKQQDRMRKSGMSEDEIAQSMASSIQ